MLIFEKVTNRQEMKGNALKSKFKFNGFDHFEEMMSISNLVEHSQMDCGIFSGELTQVICGPVIIHKHSMNRKLLQNGIGASGFTTFLLTDNLEEDLYWRKKKLNATTLGVLRDHMEHSCITTVNFSGISVTFENVFLDRFVSSMGYLNFFKTLKQNETLKIDKKDAFMIRQLVKNLCKYEIKDTEIITSDLPKLIIETILSSDSNTKYKIGHGRGVVFEKAKKLIHDNLENPINVQSLLNELGTSERNLRYAFNQHAGISPKKYINYCRLNKARKLIIAGKFEKIVESAHQIGFWHSGKFASDYKLLFGEYPSETNRSGKFYV